MSEPLISTKIPASICVECGYKSDMASGVVNGAIPKTGDLNLCMMCAHVSVFKEGLVLREPTEEEKAKIDSDRVLQKTRQTILLFHKVRKHGKN